MQLTLANLKTQGDEADSNGTVDAFVVQAVSTGSLKIGANAGAATNYASGSNDTIDASNNAYWTPAANANGTLNAFTVKAKDNSGALSATAVQATVSANAVNSTPVLGGTAVVTWTEGTDFANGADWSGGSVYVFQSATLNDPDTTTDFNGATLTVALASYGSGDSITLPPENGTVTYSQPDVSVTGFGVVGTLADGWNAPLDHHLQCQRHKSVH